MKKLKLDSSLYKIFKKAADNFLIDIEKGTIPAQYLDKIKKLINLINKINQSDIIKLKDTEFFGRVVHYAILDLTDLGKRYLDGNQKEKEILLNSFLAYLELIEINNDFCILKNLKTGENIKVVGEGEGSEYTLQALPIGTRLFSRLLKIDGEYYIMKNFQYIHINDKDLFGKWMDIRLKNVDDMYKLHNLLNEFIETYMSSYGYGNTEGLQEKKTNEILTKIQALKSKLVKRGKKQEYKKLRQILRNVENISPEKLQEFCYQAGFNEDDIDFIFEIAFDIQRSVEEKRVSKHIDEYIQLLQKDNKVGIKLDDNFYYGYDGKRLTNEDAEELIQVFNFLNEGKFDRAYRKIGKLVLKYNLEILYIYQYVITYKLVSKKIEDQNLYNSAFSRIIDYMYILSFYEGASNLNFNHPALLYPIYIDQEEVNIMLIILLSIYLDFEGINIKIPERMIRYILNIDIDLKKYLKKMKETFTIEGYFKISNRNLYNFFKINLLVKLGFFLKEEEQPLETIIYRMLNYYECEKTLNKLADIIIKKQKLITEQMLENVRMIITPQIDYFYTLLKVNLPSNEFEKIKKILTLKDVI